MKNSLRKLCFCLASAIVLFGDAWVAYSFGAHRHPQPQAAAAGAVVVAETDPVVRFRTERQQLRARQTAQLNDIIYSDRTDEETVRLAQRQLLEMLAASERELTLEGVLQARGFRDALVTFSDDSVNVLLRASAVTQQESAVILDLVLRETGVSGGNVKIIPIN